MKPDCLRGFGPVGTNGPMDANQRAIDTLEALRRDVTIHPTTDAALDTAISALRALRDAPEGWRPIENAPNGQVLLYWPATKPARGHSGQHTLSARIAVDYADSTPNRPPTHWMPLPEPPEQSP